MPATPANPRRRPVIVLDATGREHRTIATVCPPARTPARPQVDAVHTGRVRGVHRRTRGAGGHE